MRPRRVALLFAVLLGAAPLSGCFANMQDLKETLGFGEEPAPAPEPEPEPEPDPIAPVARAQANVTSALTGSPIRFTSDGSRDADGAILSFTWSFGDGSTGSGRFVEHSFASAGEFTVTLTVKDDDNLTDSDSVIVAVREPNRPPVAAIRITTGSGLVVSGGDVGDALILSGVNSSDPEGAALAYEWSLGNGATAVGKEARVTYDRPGEYVVNLTVRDPEGLTGTASRLVHQNANYSFSGSFGPAPNEGTTRAHAIVVPEGLALLNVTLTFPATLGTNALTLVLVDAAGTEAAREEATAEPGDQGDLTATVLLTPDVLRTYAAGDWLVQVEKAQGISADYTVAASVQF